MREDEVTMTVLWIESGVGFLPKYIGVSQQFRWRQLMRSSHCVLTVGIDMRTAR
jgi:hypothetical protein